MLNCKSYEFNEFNVCKIQNIFVLLNKNGSNLISLFLVFVILIMAHTLFIDLFHLFSMSVINRKKENYIFTLFQSGLEVEDVIDPTQGRSVWGCY